MKEEKSWYVIYTKPRSEKKVFKLLAEKGLQTYCPLNKTLKKWSDRMKVVEEPLFTSYVFVKISLKEFSEVKQTPGVLNFLYWCGEPAIIKEEEITKIKLFLSEYDQVELVPISIQEGEEVEIAQGLFMGEKGTVSQVEKKYVSIILNKLGYAVRAKVPTAYIKPKLENS